MPEIAHWTAWLIWIFLVLVIAYEIYARNNADPGSSLSAVLNRQIRRHPILGIAIGCLIGHLAWGQRVYVPAPAPVPTTQVASPAGASQIGR